jgi:tetratricopeptide (TPR) repeat protein
MGRHPFPAQLADFLQGRLTRRRNRLVVRHLLTDCTVCRDPAEHRPPSSDDYSGVFAAARAAAAEAGRSFAAERAEAPELLRQIAVQPFHRQWTMVTDSLRFRTWAFCELLLDACVEWGFQDPARALQTARLGVAAADRLARATYGGQRVDDLRARAWATLGNAERILTDFRAAEKSFATAETLLRSGTGDLLEKARLLLLQASLRGHQQRFAEAFQLLRRVVRIGRRYGDPHLCGKALITHGFLAAMAHEPELAIRLLQEGLPLIDPAAEPRLLVAARHNLAVGLTDSGRTREALALVEESRPLYERLGDRMSLIRLGWLEGRIALFLGDLGRAETLLVAARARFVEQGLGYDTALLSFDLAELYARQSRGAEMRRLAEEMLPIFQSREIRREAMSALLVFQRAAALERVSLSLLRELRDYLEESRSTPGLRFRDPD